MKIEPIGNAGALEMCSLGRDMYNSCLNSSSLSLISPSPFSVITTNQFAQNLHKGSERDGPREGAGRTQLRSVALLHITCIVLVHAIWILGVLHAPRSVLRSPCFVRSESKLCIWFACHVLKRISMFHHRLLAKPPTSKEYTAPGEMWAAGQLAR